jgi:hypothetical protein
MTNTTWYCGPAALPPPPLLLLTSMHLQLIHGTEQYTQRSQLQPLLAAKNWVWQRSTTKRCATSDVCQSFADHISFRHLRSTAGDVLFIIVRRSMYQHVFTLSMTSNAT